MAKSKKPRWTYSKLKEWRFETDHKLYVWICKLADSWYRVQRWTGRNLISIAYTKRLGTAKFLAEDYYFRRRGGR